MSSNRAWGAVETVAAAAAAVDALRSIDLTAVAEDSLGDCLSVLARIESQAAALRGQVLAEAERRQTALRTACTGTDAWAVAFTGDTREMNAGGLRIARLLGEKYAATREAFAAGSVTTAQVRVIVNACEQSPAEAAPAQVTAAEELLVAKATGAARRGGKPMDPKRLRQAARRMFATIDTDLADRHEAIMLGREAKHAARETYFLMSDNGDGTFSGRFTVPELHGHLLAGVLDKLVAPRRRGRGPLGQEVLDDSVSTSDGWSVGGLERKGLAFCELLEHLPTTGWALTGGGNATTVLVRVDYDDLMRRVSDGVGNAGVGRLDNGVKITGADLQRLACEAEIVPTILDGDEAVLFHGRGRRLHDRHQRNALAHLHDTCGIAGCQRPFAWTEIHHPMPWAAGGGTDIDNAVPLCGFHHQRAHDGLFDLRRDPGTGPHAWKLVPKKRVIPLHLRPATGPGAGYTVMHS